MGSRGSGRDRRKRENDPLLKKPITSEFGNVTPWIIVPGDYSPAQLQFQAENVAASIANNASFNCIATKMLITWANWPQRQAFLDLVDEVLAKVPRRCAYYPGAAERFERFTGHCPPPCSDCTLPWTLIRDAKPETSPHLFCEESFVCVCAETSLGGSDPQDFLRVPSISPTTACGARWPRPSPCRRTFVAIRPAKPAFSRHWPSCVTERSASTTGRRWSMP